MIFFGGALTVHVADLVSVNRVLIHALVHEGSKLIIKAPFVEGFSILITRGPCSSLGSAKVKVAESTSSVAHALVKRSVVRRDELAGLWVEQNSALLVAGQADEHHLLSFARPRTGTMLVIKFPGVAAEHAQVLEAR